MNGVELMLMGIYAISNLTSPPFKYILPKDRYFQNIPVKSLKMSMADVNLAAQKPVKIETLVVTSWDDEPFSRIKGTPNNYKGEGYAFYIFDLIAKKLNFTYKVIPPDSNVLGTETSGVMGLIQKKKVDMAVAFLPIMTQLQMNCSFSPPLDYADITVMLKRPRESAIGSGLLAPFDTTVWLCILVSLIIVGPVIFVITSYRSRLWGADSKEYYSFTTCVWFTYGALLKQGSSAAPEANSNRLLFATWWIYITILTSFYTANLTAFLTLSEFTLPFKSVDEVVYRRFRWCALTDHVIDYGLKWETIEPIQSLKNTLSYDGYFFDVDKNNKEEKVLHQVNQEDRVFVDEANFVERSIFQDYLKNVRNNEPENKRCKLVRMPEYVFHQTRAFAYPIGSPYQQQIDRKLLDLVETGIIQYQETITVPAVKYCPLNLQSKERQLRNSDLSLTYKTIGAGFVFATIVFIAEISQLFFKCNICLCCAKSCRCCGPRIQSPEDKKPRSNGQLPSYYNQNIINGDKAQLNDNKIVPVYENAENYKSMKKHCINGRDYWVITEHGGDKRLVPVRSPSALLFQYNM